MGTRILFDNLRSSTVFGSKDGSVKFKTLEIYKDVVKAKRLKDNVLYLIPRKSFDRSEYHELAD